MEFKAEIAERNKEIAETFARIMSNPAQFETVGEPEPHNIKFLGNMANENTFKVIDMQSLIQQHMEGILARSN